VEDIIPREEPVLMIEKFSAYYFPMDLNKNKHIARAVCNFRTNVYRAAGGKMVGNHC